MTYRHIAIALAVAVCMLGLVVTVQAAPNDLDRKRLDMVKANLQKELEAAQVIYDRAVQRAKDKARNNYEVTIRSYELRGDEETVKELRQELTELTGPEKQASAAKPLGHVKLIQSIGPAVLDADGKKYDTRGLATSQYMLVYFSASWCGPCRSFTPKLLEFFNTRRADNNFNLILVSSDRSEQEMLKYMSDYKMPWAAVPFDRIKPSGLRESYGGRGIPNLVLIDRNGRVISGSYRDGQYVGPTAVLNDLAKLLASNS